MQNGGNALLAMDEEVKTAQVKYTDSICRFKINKMPVIYVQMWPFFSPDIQPVEQHALFGAMSTPPDIPAPNVSMMASDM